MAGIVADYRISTGSIILESGGDVRRTIRFSMPEGDLVPADLPMIVTFALDSSVDGLHMRIDIDGTVVSNRRYTDDFSERTIQEIAADLGPPPQSGRREVTFTVLAGRATFSDVVLWFQRDARQDEGTVSN